MAQGVGQGHGGAWRGMERHTVDVFRDGISA